MKSITNKSAIIIVCFVIIFIFCICCTAYAEDLPADESVKSERARVISIISEEKEDIEYSGGFLKTHYQVVELKILTGASKGQELIANYYINMGFDDKYKTVPVRKGDNVLIQLVYDEEGKLQEGYITGIAREKYLLFLSILFLVLIISIGRIKGIKTVIALFITAISILKIFLPAILKGWDPVLVSVGVSCIIIVITLMLTSGLNKKTAAAIIGTVSGVVCAGFIALLFATLTRLTGFGDGESMRLIYIPQGTLFNFRGLLFAGIIIGALGAAMDVGISVASAMHEIKLNNPIIHARQLFSAGMNVGRDIMGTMSNTLLLAYTGGSLHLLLLLMAYDMPFYEIVNGEMIATEILRALSGSVGLVLTIPVTAAASVLLNRKPLAS